MRRAPRISGNGIPPDTPDAPGQIFGRKSAAADYELHPAAEYGKQWPERDHGSPVGNARKCHFCLHRLKVGMLPACTTSASAGRPSSAIAPIRSSLVSEMIGSPRVFRLKEELGTQPSVYYLK